METDYDRNRFALLARYNRSVNEALQGLLAALPAGGMDEARGSYFGSVRGILDHILVCDLNWMRRFRAVHGEKGVLAHPRLEPSGFVWSKYAFGNLDSFWKERALADKLLERFAAEADTALFGKVLAYPDSEGNPRRYVFRDALEHVFNHQTHHRGQVSQILDELGVEHDFSNFFDVLESPAE